MTLVAHKGRKRIYANVTEITLDNVREVINEAVLVHETNVHDIKVLFDISKGNMELARKKEIRPEINVQAIDPIASQIVDFKVGFEHGTPISYIQRANVDSSNAEGAINIPEKDDLKIATLNEMMREVGKASKDLQLANHIKICGLGYRFVFPKKRRTGISPFDMVTTDPYWTFCIYANDIYKTKIAGVTYTVDTRQVKHFGVWTNDLYFEFDSEYNSEIKVSVNMLGIIPIIEYRNNEEMMGCFEREIPLIDSLNIVTSDRVNDICQTVQSILWLHNTKLDDEQKEQLVDGGVIQTQQTPDGKDAKIQYVNAPLNQTEIQTLASNLHSRILESAGVPKLSDTTNTTGNATSLANGWNTAENHAKTSELMWRIAEDEMLEVCLALIRNTNTVINNVGDLKLSDIDYKMYRSENYDIVSRVNSFITLVEHGFDLAKSAAYCKITDDPQQYCMDSKENVDKLRFSKLNPMENKTEESIQPDTVAI